MQNIDLLSLANAIYQIEAEKASLNRHYILDILRASGKRSLLCWSMLRKTI